MQESVILLTVVACIAANLPFVSRRLFGVLRVKDKHFGWEALELVVLYLAVGCLARVLEAQHMPVHAQNWQFYVTTFALFTVFAFPGFVARHFWRARPVRKAA